MASDAELFWKIMVVVVFGPSLNLRARTHVQVLLGAFFVSKFVTQKSFCANFALQTCHPKHWRGAVKVAAGTAENRAILVHSAPSPTINLLDIYILTPQLHCESRRLEGTEPPLTLRQENQYLYFGHLARAFFPVVRHFF